jgi:hypothetical protein
VKCGSLFTPWENEKFDYIVNDVSGIAEEIATLSPWYDKVSCTSGVDGTLLTVEVIQNASKYMNTGGLFFFPVISLSNVEKILTEANKNFSHVEKLFHKEWPLPEMLCKHRAMLDNVQREGHIEIVEKFGMVLYFTDIYVAYNT